jgi:hypothetical protein
VKDLKYGDKQNFEIIFHKFEGGTVLNELYDDDDDDDDNDDNGDDNISIKIITLYITEMDKMDKQ